MPREYATVQGNLTRVLPDASRQDVERQVRQVFDNFACFFADLLGLNRRALPLQQAYVTRVQGLPYLQAVLQAPRGFVAATAHLGNWEAGGALLSRLDVPINVTGFDKESAEIRSLLTQASNAKFRLIPLTGSPTDAIQVVAAMRRGEVVAMLGDRAYGSPSARIPFLGSPAAFPIGAYVMAAIAGAPLVHVFNVREPGGHYHFFAFPPQRPQMPRRNEREARLRVCAARFARELESILRRDPLQWYNFYPFWDVRDQPAEAQTSALAVTMQLNRS